MGGGANGVAEPRAGRSRIPGHDKGALLVVSVVAAAGLWYGWRLFWFLTDDAYIAFRYVGNSVLGHGYVWNPPPFAPVQGYTSFLWVALLDLVWRTLGLEPPQSANLLSLVFSWMTLMLGATMVLRMNLSDRLEPCRRVFLALVLLGVMTNRTFLAWTSSGLETSLFNLTVTSWVFFCVMLPPFTTGWFLGITSTAALTSLSRPDGLLFAGMTAGLAALALRARHRDGTLRGNDWLAVAPLLLVPAHLAWCLSSYGEWLPNTYFAKTDPGRLWVASGARYSASFVLEYALWIWLAVLAAALFFGSVGSRDRPAVMATNPRRRLQGDALAADGRGPSLPGPGSVILVAVTASIPAGLLGGLFWVACLLACALCLLALRRLPGSTVPLAAAVTVLLAHALYYTLVPGGDHFEFRVYSHLILLLFVSFPWLLDVLRVRAGRAVAALGLFVLASWPVPWTHWLATRELRTREETYRLKVSTADAVSRALPFVPMSMLGYFRLNDHMQFWLIDHFVCMRHQEHKVFHEHLVHTLPTREEGLRIDPEGLPVIAISNVGVAGWVLPHVSIIDLFGLNDPVIARNSVAGPHRFMAHERRPPPGYAECFSPNVRLAEGRVVVEKREVPLTGERVRECETRYAALVSQH